jgi:ribosomal-protein-alanine N-acetyltransferase
LSFDGKPGTIEPARQMGNGVLIETGRLHLVGPAGEHALALRDYMARNRDHFAPYLPPLPDGLDTVEFWHERLAAWREESAGDQSLRLLLVERGDRAGAVIGDCAFTNIVRGPFQACHLGYKLDRQFVGRGLMREALSAAITHAFNVLRLHRIMANYQPTNERSGRLLRKLGFSIEGYARDYLYLNGGWRDHILTSLVNPSVPGSR